MNAESSAQELQMGMQMSRCTLVIVRGAGKQKATRLGGLLRTKPFSGSGGRGLFGFGFCRDFFALEITLTTFPFNLFIILLAHSSLQSFGIPISCTLL